MDEWKMHVLRQSNPAALLNGEGGALRRRVPEEEKTIGALGKPSCLVVSYTH